MTNEKTIPGIQILNSQELLGKIIDIQMDAFRTQKKHLAQTLGEELTELYGKHNYCLHLEHLTRVWVLNYNDELTFKVYTAKGKGTTIEICTDPEDTTFEQSQGKLIRNTHKVSSFLTELYDSINR